MRLTSLLQRIEHVEVASSRYTKASGLPVDKATLQLKLSVIHMISGPWRLGTYMSEYVVGPQGPFYLQIPVSFGWGIWILGNGSNT